MIYCFLQLAKRSHLSFAWLGIFFKLHLSTSFRFDRRRIRMFCLLLRPGELIPPPAKLLAAAYHQYLQPPLQVRQSPPLHWIKTARQTPRLLQIPHNQLHKRAMSIQQVPTEYWGWQLQYKECHQLIMHANWLQNRRLNFLPCNTSLFPACSLWSRFDNHTCCLFLLCRCHLPPPPSLLSIGVLVHLSAMHCNLCGGTLL